MTTVTSNIFPCWVHVSFKTLTINRRLVLLSDLEAMLPTPMSSLTYNSLATSLCISQYLVPLAGVF